MLLLVTSVDAFIHTQLPRAARTWGIRPLLHLFLPSDPVDVLGFCYMNCFSLMIHFTYPA